MYRKPVFTEIGMLQTSTRLCLHDFTFSISFIGSSKAGLGNVERYLLTYSCSYKSNRFTRNFKQRINRAYIEDRNTAKTT